MSRATLYYGILKRSYITGKGKWAAQDIGYVGSAFESSWYFDAVRKLEFRVHWSKIFFTFSYFLTINDKMPKYIPISKLRRAQEYTQFTKS